MATKKKPIKAKAKKTVAKKSSVKKTTSKKVKAPIKKGRTKATKKLATKKVVKKKKNGVDLECFLTTACVRYYHLRDNSYELNTLRNYRDTYLASFQQGQRLITEYYRVAPGIVQEIENDKELGKVYEFIFNKIKKACAEIEQRAFEAAKETYMNLVRGLQKKYKMY